MCGERLPGAGLAEKDTSLRASAWGGRNTGPHVGQLKTTQIYPLSLRLEFEVSGGLAPPEAPGEGPSAFPRFWGSGRP